MRIFVFFLIFAFAEPLRLENVDVAKMADDVVQGNRISFKDIIDGLVKNLEGHKITNVSLIEIDRENRLQDIIIDSNIPSITVDMNDGRMSTIDIKNLTVPVSHFKLRGNYHFEEISLFDLLIYGQGDVTVDITELKIFLSMKAKYKVTTKWRVSDIKIVTSVKDSHIRLDNLMYGEPMGDFLNFMTDELFKVGIELLGGLVDEYKKEVMKVIEQILNSIVSMENY